MKIVNAKDNTKIVEKILKEDSKLKVEKLYKKYKSSKYSMAQIKRSYHKSIQCSFNDSCSNYIYNRCCYCS